MSNTYEAQLAQERAQREQSQYDAIVNAIAAEQNAADLAQARLADAYRVGDP